MAQADESRHLAFAIPRHDDGLSRAEKSNSINVTSGDIIDDVLYISSPLKTSQNLKDLSSDQDKETMKGIVVTNQEKDNLQTFQLIAPDNFMIYKALSVNYHDHIDSTKPLARKISDSSQMLDVVKKSRLSDKEVSKTSQIRLKIRIKMTTTKRCTQNNSNIFFL